MLQDRFRFPPFRGIRGTVAPLALAVAVVAAGCAAPATRDGPGSSRTPAPGLHVESGDLAVDFVGVVGTGEAGSLVQDAGWNEYRLELRNLFPGPLTIVNVRLLTTDGRYVESARNYAEITAPPDAASEIAGDVARRSAGIAAGQVIPYGGTLIGLLSSAASSLSAQEQASAKRIFVLRRLKEVELAPGGRVSGSAFLPDIPNAEILVVAYRAGGESKRLEIPLRGKR